MRSWIGHEIDRMISQALHKKPSNSEPVQAFQLVLAYLRLHSVTSVQHVLSTSDDIARHSEKVSL